MWGDAATEYAHYCQHVAGLIRQHARRPATTLLDLGCGGGKNVLNLQREFTVTGVDLSPAMLAQAKDLNPGCTFVQGDMRQGFRLRQAFGGQVGWQASLRRAFRLRLVSREGAKNAK